MLKEQRFGVEVEMTGITRKKAADILAEVFGTTAGDSDGTCYYTRIIRDQKNRKWKVMRDSSITPVRNDDTDAYLDEYKVEMVTPPLDYEDIELLQSVIRKLREGGAKPHSSCGIHIHVDGANHTAASTLELYQVICIHSFFPSIVSIHYSGTPYTSDILPDQILSARVRTHCIPLDHSLQSVPS